MNLNNKNETIKAVDWVAVFPSLRLVKCGREALQPARLGLGFLWAVGIVAGLCVALKMGLTMSSPNGIPQADGATKVWIAFWGILWGGIATLFLGGALSRLAAIHTSAGNSTRLRDAKTFLCARAGSLLGAIGLMFLPLIISAGVLILGRVAASSSDMLGTVLFGPICLLGVVFAFLAPLSMGAFVFLIPAIAVDGNDGFDAPGRAVSYVFARPWQLALHLIVLAFFSAIFVGFAFGLFSAGAKIADCVLPRIGDRSSAIVLCWQVIYLSCFLAYAFSFLFTGLTRIYLLIRESADGVPETEIWHPSDDKKVTMGVEDDASAPKAQVDGHE